MYITREKPTDINEEIVIQKQRLVVVFDLMIMYDCGFQVFLRVYIILRVEPMNI
jgi:hypothetical protein